MTLFSAAVPVGLATGAAAWMLAGAGLSDLAKLEPLEAEIAALRAPRAASASTGLARAGELAAAPLFIMTVGPGAVSEPLVRLDGVSVSRRRVAALLSFAGASPEWLSVGEARNGVTLVQVTGSKAVLETLLGTRELAVGDQTGGGAPGATTQQAAAATAPTPADTPPPGYRGPPPPASAPGMR